MAKKKSLQQLDMFSMFAEPEKIAEGNEAISVAEEEKKVVIVVEKQIETTIAAKVEERNLPIASNVVFNDGKINVRIKAKVEAVPAIAPAAILVEEKEVFIEKVKRPKKAVDPNNPLKKRGRKSFKDMDAEVGLISVPDDEILNKKLYYSIGEVAKFFNVNSSLIRAWEIEFDVLQPRKNRKGDRYFRVEDIKNLQMIYYLLRNRKFSIDGAKQYLKSNKKGADTNYMLTQSLQKIRGFLLELKANLAVH